jgi:hypothetical protein
VELEDFASRAFDGDTEVDQKNLSGRKALILILSRRIQYLESKSIFDFFNDASSAVVIV